MMKLTLLFFVFLPVLWAGILISPYKKNAKACDESKATHFTSQTITNCTTTTKSSENLNKCISPGCPNDAWQFFDEDPFRLYPLPNITLVCCRSQCLTYDCDGATHYSDWTRENLITKDFGRTWNPMVYPTCPGDISRICSDDLCPQSTEIFYNRKIYCTSLTCKGQMVLDRVHNMWKCEDPTCDGPNKKMTFSTTYKTWLCQSADCEEEMMVYSPTQKKWLCNQNSLFCKQCQDSCAWDL